VTMQILTDTFDAGPHSEGDLVLDVLNDCCQMNVRFEEGAYYIYLSARASDGKTSWTRLTAYGGETPEGARVLAWKFWGEIVRTPP
jgi:hypothetical protein